MAVALGFIVLAIGMSLIYVGWKGLSLAQFWGALLTGKLPGPGTGAHN